MANVTAGEQLMLELINLARLDPGSEAHRLGIDLNEGLAAGTLTADAKQPLAFDDRLVAAARSHSLWQIDNDVFSHTGVAGSSPGDRMTAAGYVFEGLWGWGENISWYGVMPGPVDAAAAIAVQHDGLFLSPGHRTNLLDDRMREIGVGQGIGSFTQDGKTWSASVVSQDFAFSGSRVFLTGVLYQDTDSDSRYDLGEGLGNRRVALVEGGSETSVQTNAHGGYEAAIGPGPNRIGFGGTTPVVVDVQITDRNVKLDLAGTTVRSSTSLTLISGADAAQLLGIADIGIEGSAAPEWLGGNPGNNRLAGGAGADTLDAGLGADTLVGGEGNDALVGGGGWDTAWFAASRSAYTVLVAPDAGWTVVAEAADGRAAVGYDARGGDGLDVLTGIEQTSFAGAIGAVAPSASVLEYTASHADLMSAFGTDQQQAFDHFVVYGYAEGRQITFSALEYIASYPDLIFAFGADRDAGSAHYIRFGYAEGCIPATFDGMQYIASYPDLIRAFGADGAAGSAHFITNGFSEGRGTDDFDAAQYLQNYADLQAAFGADADAATVHYITYGFYEGRVDDVLA